MTSQSCFEICCNHRRYLYIHHCCIININAVLFVGVFNSCVYKHFSQISLQCIIEIAGLYDWMQHIYLNIYCVVSSLPYASNYLSQQMKNADSLLHLYAHWACLELNLGKDQAAACSVWKSLVKIWFGPFIPLFLFLYGSI